MEKIAIVGLSCLFPDAKNPEEFWQNLIDGKDSTSLATVESMGVDPAIFYDSEKGKADKTYCLKGGYIRNLELEPTKYNLSPDIIEGLDDIFKASLYITREALHDSDYLNDKEALSRCGIILGNLSIAPTKFSDQLFAPIYQQPIESAVGQLLHNTNFRLANLPSSTSKVLPCNGMTSGSLAALTAQAFSISGINFALDSACSSSLYAVKLACHYLLSHKADLMLAGGISYINPLTVRMVFAGVQAYPDDNDISRPLDKLSRGMIPSEGAGMVVLKRYSEAIRDGDYIYATICGNGLSNDGRGKHLLVPNPQGQILAFERAYAEANLTPRDIDYLECHATGTPLGDTTELSATDAFFGQHQAEPLVGAVKGNVGHLLTASGMVGMIKVLLSMSKGVIPPTINLIEPLSSPNNKITAKQIVSSATTWPGDKECKRAAVSAFGFGGNNAHLILEQHTKMESIKNSVENLATKVPEPAPTQKMAIVGMDAFFGTCDGLDAFEQSIYDGTQHFIPLPTQRWKGIEEQHELLKSYGFENGEAPLGGYIKDFDIDTLHSKIPPNEANKLNPQQLLILKVADRALRDARKSEGGNVAIIIAMETELSVHQLHQRWNLSWQIKQGLEENLKQSGKSLSPAQISQLETIIKDSFHNPVESGEFLSHIGNIMASRISSLWNFTGPSFTLNSGENSVFKALEVAQMLLATSEVDAVVVGAVDLAAGVENILLRNQLAKINTGVNSLSYNQDTNGWMVGEGAGAVVLKRLDTAKHDSDRIYAVIDGISFIQGDLTTPDVNQINQNINNFPQVPAATSVTQACFQAFTEAGVKPEDINYLEVFGSGVKQEDESEIEGLICAYKTSQQTQPDLSCAIGSVKANVGHTYAASGIASLIKTALCLYREYIPATPQWSGPKTPEVWQGSPFYVATESRPWLKTAETPKRVAAINGLGLDGTYAHIILSDEPSCKEYSSHYLSQMPFCLFPLAADSKSALLEQLYALQKTIEDCSSLSTAASQIFANFQKRQEATYVLAILGRNNQELMREVERAFEGVENAFQKGKDWQTPLGSYFTAKPLGKQGTIAFVYPGLFNSYIGLGRNILHSFPKIDNNVRNYNIQNISALIQEELLYPRSLNLLSRRQLEVIEQQLLDNPAAMLGSGIAYSVFLTAIMQDYFQIQPQSVFGYSLGELTTVCAQNILSNYEQALNNLNASSLFSNRLSGDKNAVRDYWGLPQQQNHQAEDFWSTYVLIADSSQVIEYVKSEKHLYVTHINTPEEVVIAGDTKACQKAIQVLGCNAFRIPFDYVLHCEAMRSEYNQFKQILTLPLQKVSQAIVYSAAEYKPITIDSDSISSSIAQCLCQQLDFPRLINRVYDDGTRIFIEAGPSGTCSRWIDETLKNKEHLSVTLNKRGTDDFTGILKALAQLVSHRVSLDLSPLYCQIPEVSQSKPMLKTITLGGERIIYSILSAKNKQIVNNWSLDLSTNTSSNIPSNSPSNKSKRQSNMATKKTLQTIKKQSHQLEPDDRMRESLEQSQYIDYKIINESELLDLCNSQEQKLNEHVSSVTKSHTTFLQTRLSSLHRLSELIQLQINVHQKVLEQEDLD